MEFTSHTVLFALRDAIEQLLQGTRAAAGPADSYRAMRSAYAHFGLTTTYRAPWRHLRPQVLAEEPACGSCGEPSTEVDHVLPVALGGSPRARRNLQALCHCCHSNKTAREMPRLLETTWTIDPALAPLGSDQHNPGSAPYDPEAAYAHARGRLRRRSDLEPQR